MKQLGGGCCSQTHGNALYLVVRAESLIIVSEEITNLKKYFQPETTSEVTGLVGEYAGL